MVSEAMGLAPGMAPESELSGGGKGSRDPRCHCGVKYFERRNIQMENLCGGVFAGCGVW